MDILLANPPTTYKVVCPKIWSDTDIIEPILNDLPADTNTMLLGHKVELNEIKKGLDKYNTSPENFDKIFRLFDFYTGLRNFYVNRKNAQMVSNAWLKCYEIIHDFNLTGNKRLYRAFFNAELPGAFISATNHYCKTHGIEFQWVASSYFPEEGHTALGDRYHMYENYGDQWIMDKRMNGDLTNPDILREIKRRVLKKFPRGVDSYFSDAGLDVGTNYAEQEELNALLNFGQILSGLMTLAPGGTLCIKQYSFFKPLNTSLIILLSNLFRDFQVIKPETSRPTNSEIYLLGKGYIGMLSGIEERLLTIMGQLREIGAPECANYSFYKYSPRIKPSLDRLADISNQIFISGQGRLLKVILDMVEQMGANTDKIYDAVNHIHLTKMDRYITRQAIRKLDYKDRLDTRGRAPVEPMPEPKKPTRVVGDYEPVYDYSKANNGLFGNIFRNIGPTVDYVSFITTFNKGFYKVDRNIRSAILTGLKEQVSLGKSDQELFRWLNEQMNTQVYPIYGYPDVQGEGRAKARIDEIKEIIDAIGIRDIHTVLDFGSGEGTITSELANDLGLPKEHIFSIDIKRPRNEHNYTFIQAQPDNPKIPLRDNQVDLITSLMVLHHLPDPMATIREFYRILAPGGYLIIREHDCVTSRSKQISELLDTLHGFYEAVWARTGNQENDKFPDGYYSKYYSSREWTKMITEAGFKHIISPLLINQKYIMGTNTKMYIEGAKIKNPYNFYYGVYQKL